MAFGQVIQVGKYLIQDYGFGAENWYYEGVSLGPNRAVITESSISSAITAQAKLDQEKEFQRQKAEAIRLETEAKARKEAAAKAEAEAEANRRAKLEAEQIARIQAKAEADRKAKLEAEAKAKAQAEADRLAKLAAEAKAKAQAEAQKLLAQQQADERARKLAEAQRAEAFAKARAEADRLARIGQQNWINARPNRINQALNDNLVGAIHFALGQLATNPSEFLTVSGVTQSSIDKLVNVAENWLISTVASLVN
jgi:hypothetical protein